MYDGKYILINMQISKAKTNNFVFRSWKQKETNRNVSYSAEIWIMR